MISNFVHQSWRFLKHFIRSIVIFSFYLSWKGRGGKGRSGGVDRCIYIDIVGLLWDLDISRLLMNVALVTILIKKITIIIIINIASILLETLSVTVGISSSSKTSLHIIHSLKIVSLTSTSTADDFTSTLPIILIST